MTDPEREPLLGRIARLERSRGRWRILACAASIVLLCLSLATVASVVSLRRAEAARRQAAIDRAEQALQEAEEQLQESKVKSSYPAMMRAERILNGGEETRKNAKEGLPSRGPRTGP